MTYSVRSNLTMCVQKNKCSYDVVPTLWALYIRRNSTMQATATFVLRINGEQN